MVHAAVDPTSTCDIPAEKTATEIATATTDQIRDVAPDREIGIVRETANVAEAVLRRGRNDLDDRNPPEIETVKENVLVLETGNVAEAVPHVLKDGAIAVTVVNVATDLLTAGTWTSRRSRRRRSTSTEIIRKLKLNQKIRNPWDLLVAKMGATMTMIIRRGNTLNVFFFFSFQYPFLLPLLRVFHRDFSSLYKSFVPSNRLIKCLFSL